MLAKLKRLVTGERVDLQTGEVVDQHLRLRERVDPTPMAPPVNYKREPSLMELIKTQMLQHKVEQLQNELGAETPDEAEDFDVDDPEGFEPSSAYEHERHDMELLLAYEKLQRHHLMMRDKYGHELPEWMRSAQDAKKDEQGGLGAKAPKEAPGARPKAPKEPPAAKPPSDDLDPED